MNTIPPSAFPACDTEIFRLLGTPYKPLGRDADGLDCWGFVRRVYSAAGIELPDYPYSDETVEQAEAIAQQAASGNWVRLERPAPYCVVLMGRRQIGSHIGLYHPDEVVFHSVAQSGVCGQSLAAIRAAGYSMILFYQWRGLSCPS